MDNLIDLDDYRMIWATSLARCGTCGKSWVATWPKGDRESKSYGWECPFCGRQTGLEVSELSQSED